MLYFTIYLKEEHGLIKIKLLDTIELSSDLFELKRNITKVEEKFSEYCLTNSGNYILLVSDKEE